jgi:hypothetical protein
MTTANGALDHATARAVAVRAQIRALNAEHKAAIKPLQEEFETICGKLLAYLKHVGVQNMGTDSGTIYQTTQNKASLADRKIFKDWLIAALLENKPEVIALLDLKVNANAAIAYAKTNGALPPGVNLSVEKKLGVRSPGQKEEDEEDA